MIKCLSVLFVSFLFLMTGCAPKVITNISKSYPASVTAVTIITMAVQARMA